MCSGGVCSGGGVVGCVCSGVEVGGGGVVGWRWGCVCSGVEVGGGLCGRRKTLAFPVVC